MTRDLGRQEAAEFLEIHVNTLDRWKKAGKLSYRLTPGGIARYPVEDLEHFRSSRLRLARVEEEVSDLAQRMGGAQHEIRRELLVLVEEAERVESAASALKRAARSTLRRVG